MTSSIEEVQSEKVGFLLDTNLEPKKTNNEDQLSKDELTLSSKSVIAQQFRELLIEAIDEALCSLGEPVKNTIYQHLHEDFKITKNNIPERMEEFSELLHKVFGLGASRLEVRFIKNLNAKLNAAESKTGDDLGSSKWIVMEMSFTKYVCDAQKEFECKANAKRKRKT
jgi:hypothetical protein